MKKLTLTLLMLCAIMYSQGQEEVDSKIESVKVFIKGAEVVRTASVSLKKGKNELKLSKLSANLDSKTIQISGENFKILSVRHSPDFVENENTPENIQTLVSEKDILLDSIALLDVQLKILLERHTMLLSNMSLIGDSGIKNEDFKEAMKYFDERFEKISIDQFLKEKERTKLIQRIENLYNQIRSAAGKVKDPPSNILLTLDSETDQEVKLKIAYSISEAGWFPAYDIRAVNTSSPIELTYKARVYQNSGVDWKNVKLSISSGDIESSGTAPKLLPYYIGNNSYQRSEYIYGSTNNNQRAGYYDPSITGISGRVTDESGLGLPQVSVILKGSTQGVATGVNGYYNLQIPPGGGTLIYRFLGYGTQEVAVGNQNVINVKLKEDVGDLGEVVVTAFGIEKEKRSLGYSVATLSADQLFPGQKSSSNVVIRGTSTVSGPSARPKRETKTTNIMASQINYQTTFVYNIDIPYDVPSTGEPQVVHMISKEMETEYVYYSAPKLKEQAYLVAKISDWAELNLIDGESNLYFENSFVGKSIIDTNVGMDTLNLSLGKDEGIIVNRERMKDFEENKFLSNKKREERHWLITVVNTKSDTVNIKLNDQIPVPVKSNFKVSIIDISEAKHKKESGLLTWDLKLAPGEKKELRVRYYVDQPKDSDVIVH